MLLGLFPVLGALSPTWVLIASFDYNWYPVDSESGTSWFGVGPPFFLGAFFILSGVVVMLLAERCVARSRPFFSRKMETVETMVPWDESPDDLLAEAAAPTGVSLSAPRGARAHSGPLRGSPA